MDKKDKHSSLDSDPHWMSAGKVNNRENDGAIYSSVKDPSFNSSPITKHLKTLNINGEILSL